jgi:hypothetical protein
MDPLSVTLEYSLAHSILTEDWISLKLMPRTLTEDEIQGISIYEDLLQ